MSKPLNEEIFIEFKSDLAERKNEVLLQVLELLDQIKMKKWQEFQVSLQKF